MECSDWLERLQNLRSDVSAARWPAATLHRAPHKPLLLLTILDLFAQGLITTNLIQYHVDLTDTFELYWTKVMGTEKRTTWMLPFFHLQRDGFWYLIPVPGMESALQVTAQIKSFSQMEQMVIGARLDDSLFAALASDSCRDILRRFLIERYFAPEVRPALVEVGKMVSEAFQYSLGLYSQTKRQFVLNEAEGASLSYAPETRSVAFRKVVITAYDHQCAVCGTRLLTPEGRTAVEAAHIVPWSVSYNDDPRNGLALCGVHHWAFDQGLIGIASTYSIAVSPIVTQQAETAELIYRFEGRPMVVPHDDLFYPAKRALDWHYRNTFRADSRSSLL